MGLITLAVTILIILGYSNELPMEKLEDVLVYPVEPTPKIRKRQTEKRDTDLRAFIEEKLIQHTQALEHLVKSAQRSEDLTSTLIENLIKIVEKPQMPEKLEEYNISRTSHIDDNDHPIVKLGKQIPKYGNLVKNVIMKEIRNDVEPLPVVDEDGVKGKQLFSRRSFNGQAMTVPTSSLPDNNKISPWCEVAMVCRRTVRPVCGFDDNFGYGKFDDICHMLQVNCYWKYNFDLVPSCKPWF